MGIERIIDEPIQFFLMDREYFVMVLEAFRGL